MGKGQVWVSAILYLALGIVVISLIIGIAMPLVNKMRDRNTVIQTKTLMAELNNNVVDVINEGPGSKRYLSPFSIERGEMYIALESTSIGTISWNFITKNKLMEPNIDFQEGDIKLRLSETPVVDEYNMIIKLEYPNVDLKLDSVSGLSNPFVGTYSMTIENSGYVQEDKPTITIYMKAT